MSYYQFVSPSGEPYGSFEVFYDDSDESYGHARNFDFGGNPIKPGWYWWACLPGCLPDSDAFGPFASENEAIINAKNWNKL